jgi:hypothetical protein
MCHESNLQKNCRRLAHHLSNHRRNRGGPTDPSARADATLCVASCGPNDGLGNDLACHRRASMACLFKQEFADLFVDVDVDECTPPTPDALANTHTADTDIR